MGAERVRAEIDLEALAHNLAVVRRRVGPGVRVILVVKSDAYGHGAVPVARRAERCGVGALGVATVDEACELRAAGIGLRIVVLGLVLPEEAEDALRADVDACIQSPEECFRLDEAARRLGIRARVHVNVDTGMGRLGALPGTVPAVMRAVRDAAGVELAGMMTHLSSPEGTEDPWTAVQLARFTALLDSIGHELPRGSWIHVSSSVGVFTGLVPIFDTVRAGICAYGVLPGVPAPRELRPVLSLRSRIALLKDLPPGTPVGYSSTWATRTGTRMATIPIGYEDGIPRRLSNRGEVLVRGQRAPIVGTISMDYLTVDVGAVPNVRVGDPVTFVGTDGAQTIGIVEVASTADTVPYEILCGLGRRVERVYRGAPDLEVPAQPARPTRSGAPDPSRLRAPLPEAEPELPRA